MGSMLYLDETPAIGCGGDTLFANMYLALRDAVGAHEGVPRRVDRHARRRDPLGAGLRLRAQARSFQKNEHPVVVRHPETGRKLLYVNRGFTSHIRQLPGSKARRCSKCSTGTSRPSRPCTCRVRWTPNTLVFWDNRCTQHQAIWDYYPLDRAGHRVSIVGERPTT